MSQNVGMSSCCLSGKVHQGKPTGRDDEIGGLSTYISEPENHSNAKSIIFISDGALPHAIHLPSIPPYSTLLTHQSSVFGYKFPNTRLLADQYAKAGFYTYVPDFHQGDSLPISFLDNIEPPLKTQETLSLVDKAKNAAIVPTTLGPWLITHREGVSRPLIDGFVNTVRMTPGTNKIGAVGFCWGGRYAILQAHGQDKSGQGRDVGGYVHFRADPSQSVLKLSHKTRFGSKRTFLRPRPVLQLYFLPRISNIDSELCVAWTRRTLVTRAWLLYRRTLSQLQSH